jgi:hypothetical protein
MIEWDANSPCCWALTWRVETPTHYLLYTACTFYCLRKNTWTRPYPPGSHGLTFLEELAQQPFDRPMPISRQTQPTCFWGGRSKCILQLSPTESTRSPKTCRLTLPSPLELSPIQNMNSCITAAESAAGNTATQLVCWYGIIAVIYVLCC